MPRASARTKGGRGGKTRSRGGASPRPEEGRRETSPPQRALPPGPGRLELRPLGAAEAEGQGPYLDEGNVARLGLISIQERIPPDLAQWEEELEFMGRPVRLACYASPAVGGVPHGLDNEISMALIVLYLDAGSPPDGSFTTSAYAILRLLGLDTSGYYYRALRESLLRLATATFVLSEAWRTPDRWQNVTFRFIERLEYTSSPEGQLDRGTTLRITLAKEVAESLRSRFVKPIDLEFMSSLRRPLARSLYRLLDAHRLAPDGQGPLAALEFPLLDWAKLCKIHQRRPDKIRRTLEPAHEELLQKGYLERVEYLGRGQAQRIRYLFGQGVLPPADAEALDLLLKEGVGYSTAYALARRFPRERIRERIQAYRALLERGYRARNPQGLLVDLIRDEGGRYQGLLAEVQAPARPALPLEVPEETGPAWEDLPPEAQRSRALRTLDLLYRRRLSVGDLEDIARLLEAGRLDPKALVEEGQRAFLEGRAEAWLAELRRALDQAAGELEEG